MEDLIRGRHKLKEGKRELMGTIIHEELETRIMKTAYIHGSEKFKAMFNGRDKMIHPYINNAIARCFRMKGVSRDDNMG